MKLKKIKNTYTKKETQNCPRKQKLKKKSNLLLLCSISNMEFRFIMKTHKEKAHDCPGKRKIGGQKANL